MEIQIEKNIQVNGKKLIGKLTVPKSGIVLLRGVNGVGKTTFFRHLKTHAIVEEIPCAFLDQLPLVPLALMTVADVFECLAKELPSQVQGPWEQFDLLKEVNIANLLHRPVTKLSGGENQLVKILLCLYQKADMYLMDEPFHFLDMKNYQKILDIIQTLAKQKRFLIIEHRNIEIEKIASHIYQFFDGDDIVLEAIDGV